MQKRVKKIKNSKNKNTAKPHAEFSVFKMPKLSEKYELTRYNSAIEEARYLDAVRFNEAVLACHKSKKYNNDFLREDRVYANGFEPKISRRQKSKIIHFSAFLTIVFSFFVLGSTMMGDYNFNLPKVTIRSDYVQPQKQKISIKKDTNNTNLNYFLTSLKDGIDSSLVENIIKDILNP